MKIIKDIKLYDLEEGAKIFGVSRQSFASWIKKYGIKTVVIMRKKYISEEDITTLLEAMKK